MMEYLYQRASAVWRPAMSLLWWPSTSDLPVEHDQTEAAMVLSREQYYLVQLQELVLWIHPNRSILALAAFHLAFLYLAFTASTVLNLTAWTGILGLIYFTWVHRIWPEIRVAKTPNSAAQPWTPVTQPEDESEDFFHWLLVQFGAGMTRLRMIRTESPGWFCLWSSAFFAVLGYLGSHVTAMALLYIVVVGALTIPALVTSLLKTRPHLFADTWTEEKQPEVEDDLGELKREIDEAVSRCLSLPQEGAQESSLIYAEYSKLMANFYPDPTTGDPVDGNGQKDGAQLLLSVSGGSSGVGESDDKDDFEFILNDELATLDLL